MNPLNTFEKAKLWADERAKFFADNVSDSYFVVCTHGDGYIVHNVKHIYAHKNEYSSKEILYCTDKHELKMIILTLRLLDK